MEYQVVEEVQGGRPTCCQRPASTTAVCTCRRQYQGVWPYAGGYCDSPEYEGSFRVAEGRLQSQEAASWCRKCCRRLSSSSRKSCGLFHQSRKIDEKRLLLFQGWIKVDTQKNDVFVLKTHIWWLRLLEVERNYSKSMLEPPEYGLRAQYS